MAHGIPIHVPYTLRKGHLSHKNPIYPNFTGMFLIWGQNQLRLGRIFRTLRFRFHIIAGGGFKYSFFLIFTPILLFGEDSHFDEYFSRGLKPPNLIKPSKLKFQLDLKVPSTMTTTATWTTDAALTPTHRIQLLKKLVDEMRFPRNDPWRWNVIIMWIWKACKYHKFCWHHLHIISNTSNISNCNTSNRKHRNRKMMDWRSIKWTYHQPLNMRPCLPGSNLQPQRN